MTAFLQLRKINFFDRHVEWVLCRLKPIDSLPHFKVTDDFMKKPAVGSGFNQVKMDWGSKVKGSLVNSQGGLLCRLTQRGVSVTNARNVFRAGFELHGHHSL